MPKDLDTATEKRKVSYVFLTILPYLDAIILQLFRYRIFSHTHQL